MSDTVENIPVTITETPAAVEPKLHRTREEGTATRIAYEQNALDEKLARKAAFEAKMSPEQLAASKGYQKCLGSIAITEQLLAKLRASVVARAEKAAAKAAQPPREKKVRGPKGPHKGESFEPVAVPDAQLDSETGEPVVAQSTGGMVAA